MCFTVRIRIRNPGTEVGENDLAAQAVLVRVSVRLIMITVPYNFRWDAGDWHEQFGHDNNFVSRQFVLFNRAAKDFFRKPVRVHLRVVIISGTYLEAVHDTYVGSVEGVYAIIVAEYSIRAQSNSAPKRLDSRSLDVLQPLLLRKNPVAEPFGIAVRHAPQDDFGDFQARLAQAD
jgi:hypothetical protein